MSRLAIALFAVCLLNPTAFAKDKKKNALPAYVLTARTIAVMIDPHAGISIDDPRANQVAREDVERALLDWGRLEPTLKSDSADLIIVIRKGNGRLMNETIPDSRQNNRAGAINPMSDGIAIDGQHGQRTPLGGDANDTTNPQNRGPVTEIGNSVDFVAVYKGNVRDPLTAPVAWRYQGNDGLQPHSVPAVASFRKAIEEAEKAAAKQP